MLHAARQRAFLSALTVSKDAVLDIHASLGKRLVGVMRLGQ